MTYGPMIEPENIPHEPDEEDATLQPSGYLGSLTTATLCGKVLGEYAEEGAAELAIAVAMRQSGFWPDVWTISDHGNALCISSRFYAEHAQTVYPDNAS
jgi:hypothetical protein